ncbi:hypothetical protein GALMADRAFT_918920 [Galerina marginata CBS 339.88]|uniref:Uncharacterized protein n=1 Tax=Galerina marginata (strain CBS 339.88) TaxID=685588 RepID=A0A067SNU2_GALM3|nr:hypothetical protein GALMADRAFT_918920 [Galerina marginata CBS 339.88]
MRIVSSAISVVLGHRYSAYIIFKLRLLSLAQTPLLLQDVDGGLGPPDQQVKIRHSSQTQVTPLFSRMKSHSRLRVSQLPPTGQIVRFRRYAQVQRAYQYISWIAFLCSSLRFLIILCRVVVIGISING